MKGRDFFRELWFQTCMGFEIGQLFWDFKTACSYTSRLVQGQHEALQHFSFLGSILLQTHSKNSLAQPSTASPWLHPAMGQAMDEPGSQLSRVSEVWFTRWVICIASNEWTAALANKVCCLACCSYQLLTPLQLECCPFPLAYEHFSPKIPHSASL